MFKGLIVTLCLTLCASLALAAEPGQLRIGYQKSSVSMVLAREHQLLEKALPGTQVQWIEFPGGPQLIEALNGGSVDVGNIGDIPPIFAQAAGIDLQYIGVEPSDGKTEAILLPKNSQAQRLGDLKGKRVALLKGSSAHNFFLKSLQRAGLKLSDVNLVYLSPADARAAFEQGKLDAWVIWDPYYSAALLDGSARLLSDGQGLDSGGSFYIASGAFVRQHGAAVAPILKAFGAAQQLSFDQREASIDSMTRILGLQRPVVESYFSHRSRLPLQGIDARVVANQQRTADLFLAYHLIPKAVRIEQIVFKSE
ncbi:sulfonate transport system substrate-binding protein [Pseudomonas chlororaphis]|uniref:aliphatic sulfonate ABC transporter substrate-binding protein n=1 Tax=Pseudomonas chlororaphis TaxID=587753 RepID=UPI00087CF165|nr:aliphatic sulfonate ABC transporter substrate-binding protein [Pseudomonas chlororaphis]AZD68840.1 Alkanesulfonate ABC transporter substrate-binding protein SsuA [Pseudomonas chlororaphis subsp. aurantiaca]QIT24709.1 aliphatic sulfonate ABC transporter substrate-binding protein [Pseudomonas chlororaphis subsp. aurantiaca]WDH02822.1 aliphatic sulfonate ABC transporter substrate-binding protein [Pseudomonas chlororaphis]WDH08330.1 aliphatic sulfonate ABC transporter substrate-binding protein [